MQRLLIVVSYRGWWLWFHAEVVDGLWYRGCWLWFHTEVDDCLWYGVVDGLWYRVVDGLLSVMCPMSFVGDVSNVLCRWSLSVIFVDDLCRWSLSMIFVDDLCRWSLSMMCPMSSRRQLVYWTITLALRIPVNHVTKYLATDCCLHIRK